MAYSSELDIKLPQAPTTGNREVYGDFVNLYNAVHILNSALNQVIQRGRGNEDGDPWESATFSKFLNVPASMDIRQGDLVTITDLSRIRGKYSYNPSPFPNYGPGAVRGWLPSDYFILNQDSVTYGFQHQPGFQHRPNNVRQTMLSATYGIAFSDAKKGDIVKVAIDSGVIKVDDSSMFVGQTFVTRPAFEFMQQGLTSKLNSYTNPRIIKRFDGRIFKVPYDHHYYFLNALGYNTIHAGVCVAPNAILIEPPARTYNYLGYVSRPPIPPHGMGDGA